MRKGKLEEAGKEYVGREASGANIVREIHNRERGIKRGFCELKLRLEDYDRKYEEERMTREDRE